jgi:hypothetical protein
VTPSQVLKWYMIGWLAAVAALVAYRILTGRIALDGLFTMDGNRFSPERMQLLLVTVGALAIYASEALAAPVITTKALPPVPEGLLAILTGSHVLYLGGKISGR